MIPSLSKNSSFQIQASRILFASIVLLSCIFLSSCRPSIFDVPEPSFHTLSNGMKVFVLEDHSLPTFRLFLIHPAGAVFEKADERELASITAELLRTGGTREKTPIQVDDHISDASATIEFGADRESAWGSFRVLNEDRRAILNLFSEMLQEPRFDKNAFEVARRQALFALRQSKENPSGISSLYFPGLIYGKNSPWAAVPTEVGLASLHVEQAKSFYENYYYPDRMILAVSGDFETKRMLEELEATLGQWQKKSPGKVQWPEYNVEDPQMIFIQKEAAQVALRLGHIGKKRSDPDKFPLFVANFILGGSGSMTSRLGSEIRSAQGQAYSIWSHFGFNRIPGVFYMTAETEALQHEEVTEAMRRILKELQEKGALKEEVREAKEAIRRSLFFTYESRFSIVKSSAQFEYWGYPRNYLQYFSEQIGKVSDASVNRVLREHFHPEKLTVLVVGPENVLEQLRKKNSNVRKMLIE